MKKKLILASSLLSLTIPNVWAEQACNPQVAETLMDWANCVNKQLGIQQTKINQQQKQITTLEKENQRLKALEPTVQAMIGDAEVLPPNLIRNSYMTLLKGKAPAGYKVGGNVTLEAVHPFTKGFEGPYTPSKPKNAANSIEEASEQHPYWFRRYYKGRRASRGGLADGWNGLGDGKILKITGDNSGTHTSVFFPYERNILAKRVRFKAWIKIVSAKKVGFGVDSGYMNRARSLVITKEQAEKAPDGWYRIDNIIRMSRVTNLSGNAFSLGIEADDSPFEVYLALPYLGIVDDDSWLPSVSDTLSRDGLTIRPDNSYVGIGTTNPGAKLDVNGNIHVNGNIRLAHSESLKKGIYSKTFMVNGDANTYYPVVINTASHGRVLNMQIWRNYSWTAPDTWNTKTHKGALTVELEMFGSKWGGNGNMYRIKNFFQQYSEVISKIKRPGPSGYSTVLWLRGGGATYVIEGDFDNVQNSKVYYKSTKIYDHKNDAWDVTVAPTTKVEQTFVNYSQTFAGKVGIGTSTPSEKLQVNGNVKAKAFKTGDIFFQKDGQTLWQMFEDENGLYLKQLKTDKTYRLMLEEIK